MIGPDATISLAEVEARLRSQALAIAARALEQRLDADTSDGESPSIPCACGGTARYVDRREKSFLTVLGSITLHRAYYHCEACHHGTYPRDQQLGLAGGSVSPGVLRMVGLIGASTSFAEGSRLLAELAGVEVGVKRVERTAKSLGEELAAIEREATAPEVERGLPPTLYVGMDGTGVPIRKAELEGRQGKEPDGSARTRESKLCVVWSAEGRTAKGVPVRDADSMTCTAAIESAATRDTDAGISQFAQRASRESSRRRFPEARRRVVLGDGAHWIWNVANELFPGAVEIVDLFHAKEHLAKLAAALWRAGSEDYNFWLTHRYDQLEAGDIEALVTSIEVHSHHSEEASKEVGYFTDNRERMRYSKFREEGLCVSSGVLEAFCKNVVGARLKRSGMHWSVKGANAITSLRCAVLSNRYDDYLDLRTAALPETLPEAA